MAKFVCINSSTSIFEDRTYKTVSEKIFINVGDIMSVTISGNYVNVRLKALHCGRSKFSEECENPKEAEERAKLIIRDIEYFTR